ncbi:hypothetical protein CVT24_009631 [Panaeolus cyanescens]|uniref:Uncharacterized protein n=1 Tax=Panaeolus cyanescens TaxID=181874 RepID=A0A409YA09_9AGAR|nr:hypothetical protein CVT24_009631 [Panaeolus cyanescens]
MSGSNTRFMEGESEPAYRAPDPPAPRRVPCVCNFKCSKLTYKTPLGVTLPGQLVHPSTRLSHSRKDQAMQEMKTSEALQSPEPLPEAPLEENTRVHQSRFRMVAPGDAAGMGVGESGDRDTSGLTRTAYLGDSAVYIQTAVCLLAAWLHLVAGLSRESVNTTMKAINIIAMLVFNLSYALANQQFGQMPSLSSSIPDIFSLPEDVRTAMLALSLEPNIIRIVCCPKCYKNYREEELPLDRLCTYRETKRSRICNEPLFTTRNTRSGPKTVPRTRFSIQDFESWLEYFLACPGIEEEIEKSYQHQRNVDRMTCLWDSPAWQNGLPGFSMLARGNLTFGFFIDWFNPLLNKIAGKIASAGAIIFFCLNLPNELQCRPEYTYFAGITPPPKEPTVETITALSDPIIQQFRNMWSGKIIRSSFYPNGLMRRIAILAALGDLLAMRKALGFAGIGSDAHFCSFCHLHKNDIEELDVRCFIPRIGSTVTAAARKWKDATTKTERKTIFAQHGVRWSSLHNLDYRDPVKHTVLGVMHNWIEGVLQHHTRHRWGIGADKDKQSKPTKNAHFNSAVLDADGDTLMEDAVSDSDSDSEPPVLPGLTSDVDSDDPGTDIEFDDFNQSPSLDGDVSDDDIAHSAPAASTFTTDELQQIRSCLSDSTIPSWVERPPVNLGEKSHGKLKADQWLKLYTVFLPLVLPELWLSSGSTSSNPRRLELLNNFHSLVLCTHKVCAYATSNDDADLYLHHYISYRRSSQTLFPHAPSRPNHHYAMHNADLLKFWGPLIRISEFPFEHHNGDLQKINTNNHMWELDYTMLRQICKRGRLKSSLQKHTSTLSTSPVPAPSPPSPLDNETIQPLLPDPNHPSIPLQQLAVLLSKQGHAAGSTSGKPSPNVDRLDDEHYHAWLKYMNDPSLQQPSYRNHTSLPHPENACVLPAYANYRKRISYKTRLYTSHDLHAGNSSILFQNLDKSLSAGFIQAMWEFDTSSHLDAQSQSRVFILVSPHKRLNVTDEMLNPYSSLPGLKADLVYAQIRPPKDHLVIEKEHIVAHLPFYIRPRGTFGISQSTIVLVNSLQRDL